jgi:hypothetical protein
MRIDIYTRIILTVIALFLAVIALRPFVQPAAVRAQASAPLAGVQFIPESASFDAFNTANGDVWLYSWTGSRYDARYMGRIVQLGEPIVRAPQAAPPR